MSKKKDKIFGANKGDYREELQDTNFKVDPGYTSLYTMDFFDDVASIDSRDIANIVEETLEGYEDKLLDRNYNFKKVEIADLYSQVRKATLKYPRIQVLMIFCRYLNAQPNKVYNFLGNAHKNEIIEEFEEKTGLVSKRGIRRLF